jgi:hypothetical protein
LIYQQDKTEIEKYTKEVKKVEDTLVSSMGTLKNRLSKFKRLKRRFARSNDSVKNSMSETMQSFRASLFVNDDELSMPEDNLDLERWFKKPKGHERKIHGHKHVGIRIVNEGPTLLPTLDAHILQKQPFTYENLLPYAYAVPPESQIRSIEHKRIMTKGSSKKKEHTC